MKLKVKEIPRSGLEIDESLEAAAIGLIDENFQVIGPLKVKGDIHRAQDTIVADVDVAGKYQFSCSRCLEPLTEEREDKFQLYFDVDPVTDVIDLGDEIRQEILLSFPPVMLCKPDCQGLCAKCGENLNLGKCKCNK